jgi:hypothetical protein
MLLAEGPGRGLVAGRGPSGQVTVAGGGLNMNAYLLMMTFRVWFLELAVTAVNYFFLMSKVYEPRYGKLKAHQIGMSARIVYIFVFAYFILFFAKRYTVLDALTAGVFWLLLILAFEWIGSLIQRRPAREILEGWHINKGFMWPYVLAAYLLSPLIVGLILHPGQ